MQLSLKLLKLCCAVLLVTVEFLVCKWVFTGRDYLYWLVLQYFDTVDTDTVGSFDL